MSAVRIIVAVAVVLALAGSAAAGPPDSGRSLPGTVVNFAEPGLARTSDGVLHLVYTRKNGTKEDLAHVTVSGAGKVGSTAVALAGWSSMSHPDLLRMPDGSLRVFFGGIRSTNPGETNTAMNTATAPASGAQWSLQIGQGGAGDLRVRDLVRRRRPGEERRPDLELGGHPRPRLPLRRRPEHARRQDPQSGCCLYHPDIGVDSASGQAWVGFTSNETREPRCLRERHRTGRS